MKLLDHLPPWLRPDIHSCCGCSCHVCADDHGIGNHSDACHARIDNAMRAEDEPISLTLVAVVVLIAVAAGVVLWML